MDDRDETWVLARLEEEPDCMELLRAASRLQLPDWWIAAGFVRNRVWDVVLGAGRPHPDTDVDVIYHDPSDTGEEREKRLEAALHEASPEVAWSVKNQARMHLLHGHDPYPDCAAAIERWPETATCVAVTMGDDGALRLSAPLGIRDLVEGVVRRNPRVSPEVYAARLESKGWGERWPGVRICRP